MNLERLESLVGLDVLERIKNSAQQSNINVEIAANFVFFVNFFVVKNNTTAVKIPSTHPGTLAVNSFTVLKIANDKFSSQKNKGGFSKK